MNQDATTKNKRPAGSGAVLSFAGFILCSLGITIFLFNQNQSLKQKLAKYEVVNTTPTSSPIPVANTINEPILISPLANSIVKSPLKITGIVPSGWMNEGVFPIKLTDQNGKVIAQVNGREKNPNSWQSGQPVDFEAVITFRTSTGSGILVLENDNPSGDPATTKSLKVAINF